MLKTQVKALYNVTVHVG